MKQPRKCAWKATRSTSRLMLLRQTLWRTTKKLMGKTMVVILTLGTFTFSISSLLSCKKLEKIARQHFQLNSIIASQTSVLLQVGCVDVSGSSLNACVGNISGKIVTLFWRTHTCFKKPMYFHVQLSAWTTTCLQQSVNLFPRKAGQASDCRSLKDQRNRQKKFSAIFDKSFGGCHHLPLVPVHFFRCESFELVIVVGLIKKMTRCLAAKTIILTMRRSSMKVKKKPKRIRLNKAVSSRVRTLCVTRWRVSSALQGFYLKQPDATLTVVNYDGSSVVAQSWNGYLYFETNHKRLLKNEQSLQKWGCVLCMAVIETEIIQCFELVCLIRWTMLMIWSSFGLGPNACRGCVHSCSNRLQFAENSNLDLLIAGSALEALSSDDITTFATKIGADWKKLAPQLNIKPKDVKEIEEDSEDVVLQVMCIFCNGGMLYCLVRLPIRLVSRELLELSKDDKNKTGMFFCASVLATATGLSIMLRIDPNKRSLYQWTHSSSSWHDCCRSGLVFCCLPHLTRFKS